MFTINLFYCRIRKKKIYDLDSESLIIQRKIAD
jgi:hypothetical protein